MKLKAYRPYKQDNFNYDTFITRLAPGEKCVFIDFESRDKSFTISIFKDKEIIKEIKTDSNHAFITDLPINSLLSVKVTSEHFESEERKFHTGDYRLDLINYVDKEETQYAYSGNFLGSPFIIKFKNQLWATMDLFKNGGTTNNGHIETILFTSKNEGLSWDYVCDFVPSQWGRLFVLEDKLYFYGANLVDNTVEMICSNDGYSWGDSIKVLTGYVCTPTSIVVNKDYVIFALRSITSKDSHLVLACGDIKKGLMNESSWKVSNEIIPEFSWGGDQNIRYSEEGNVIEYDEKIYALYRFAYKKSSMFSYDPITNTLKFENIIDLECGWCKFFIQKYNGTYYAIGNTTCFPRQVIKLYKSNDIEHWEEVKVIDDITYLDKDFNGIQYPSFFIEDDIIYLVLRIALNGSETFHNSNAIGFKKIRTN